MKLQAVTICINYADYLECNVANRRHFDRWVVVTVAGDAATAAVCARHGIEVVLSQTLQADGRDFNAAHNKARALNEGLAALDPTGWAVILDSDVLLPRHFRERVEALPLEKGCLYAAAGRKICEDREMFEMLRLCEPWDRFCDRHSQALGYFNLFHLGHPVNRYPERRKGETGGHDDWFFTTSFPPECRRQIPMTVIHTGAPARNWAGRVAASYDATGAAAADTELPEEIAGTGSVAVIGYFPGSRWLEMAERFAKVLLVDQCQVHHPSGSAMVEADRAVLRRLWAKEAEDCGNVELLGPHSAGTLARIADGSLDALYLPGEVTPDWLTVALRHWAPKLRDGALVCGDLYGLPHWREATFTIGLLLGAPDEVQESGFWWKRMRAADWRFVPMAEDGDFSAQDGVVLVNRAKETLEKLLLTLHTVRGQWAGPVAVYHWGDEDPSLTIACGRMRARLWNVGEVREGEVATVWLEEVAAMQPFRRALILQPGMLAVGRLERAFAASGVAFEEKKFAPLLALREAAIAGGEAASFPRSSPGIEGTQRVPLQSRELKLETVKAVNASVFQGHADEPPLLICDGEPATWTEAAWEAWSVAEAELAQTLAAGVRMAADATVVTFVDEENVADFQRSSLTWNFPPRTPVLVVLVGLCAEDVWLPSATPETRMLPLSRKQVDDVPWLLGWLARNCTTARVIFLPANATALPGAELWVGESWAQTNAVVHWSHGACSERRVTNNRFVPEPFCGMLARTRLVEVAATEAARAATLRELPLVMHEVLRVEAGQTAWVNVVRRGWRRPATHLYVPTSERVKKAIDTRVIVRKNADGEWLLADDVVVISLPERADRRKRVCATMARPHRVKFRFVDGVRVQDAEIVPEEIADVDLHTFKLIAGAQKFLRGTVGCRRAHVRCLEDAYSRGLHSLLLVEDDMQFVEGWFERYVAAVSELPKGWLQLYLSSSNMYGSEPCSANLHRLGGSYQTTAILYSEAGIEAALKTLRRSRCEIDVWLANHLHPFGGSYAIHPRITFQQGGVSDIMSFDRGVTA